MLPLPGEQTDAEQPRELGDRPQSRREWHGSLRSIVLPLLAVAAIIGSIWYLETDGDLPILGGGAASPQPIPEDATFVSLESQGIKLGAAGGPAPEIGQPAPDFALVDLNGKLLRLSELRGKTIVLNAWATWCTPCRREFPELVDVYERNKDRGLVVIGLNLREAPANVRKFANEFGATFPIVIDADGSVIKQYRLLGLPSTWFIDREGVLRAQHVGLLSRAILAANLTETGFQIAENP